MTPQPVGAGGGWTSGWMTQLVDAAAVGQGGCQGGLISLASCSWLLFLRCLFSLFGDCFCCFGHFCFPFLLWPLSVVPWSPFSFVLRRGDDASTLSQLSDLPIALDGQ